MALQTIRAPLGAIIVLAALLSAGCDAATSTPEVAGPPVPTAAEMDSLLAGAEPGDSLAPPPVTSVPDTTAATMLTLHDVGLRDGVTLQGAVARATLTLPVNRGMTPRTLVLDVTPTPQMPGATIHLAQGERLLAQRPLTDSTRQVTFPLDGVVVDAGRAAIVLGVSIPGRDVCAADLTYRTVIAPGSHVTYGGARVPTGGMNDFFQPWVRRVVFYLPDAPSLDAAQAALDAAAFVGRAYRGMSTEFAVLALPADGVPMSEPAWDERAIVWAPAAPTMVLRPEGGRGTVLALGSRRDARQLFTLSDGARLVPTDGFSSTLVRPELASPIGTATRTLAELGFGERTVEGSGVVVAGYAFALADFGRNVAPRAVRVLARHSILPADGYGSMRLMLNGQLIASRGLEGTDLDGTFTLPAHLLARDNRLEVRFHVVLGEGGCILGGPTFTATVDARSAFVLGDAGSLPPSFDRFPAAMVPAFSVLLEPRDRFRVELAARTIGAMQQTTTTPLAPFVVRDRADARGALLAIGTGPLAEALGAPLSGDGFQLRDLEGRIWDAYAPTASFAAMQAFREGGRDVLLLHHTREDGAPLDAMLRETLAPYGWFGVHGDLALRGAEGPATVLTAANAGWIIDRTVAEPPSRWQRWRTAIFLGAGILLIILAIWLYPRVVRRELDTTG